MPDEGLKERLKNGELIDLTATEDKSVPAEWIVELSSGSDRSYPAALRLIGVTITGDLILRFITFPHEVILRNCELAGTLNCRGTRFHQSVHFDHCNFKKDAVFDRATVGGTILFSGSTFEKQLSLVDAVVDHNVIGIGVTIEGDLRATRIRTGKTLAFNSGVEDGKVNPTVIRGETVLFDAQVGATAEFSGVTFSGRARFVRMRAIGAAIFNSIVAGPDEAAVTTFGGRAEFFAASFGTSEFRGVRMEGFADFAICSFGSVALFSPIEKYLTLFQDDASFTQSHANGWFHFPGARFSKRALFSHVRAYGLDFSSANIATGQRCEALFSGATEFTGSKIDGPIYFVGARFESTAAFNSMTVAGDAFFDSQQTSDIYFASDAKFIGSSFGGMLSFRGARFERKASFETIRVTSIATFTGIRAQELRLFGARFSSDVELLEAEVKTANLWGMQCGQDLKLSGGTFEDLDLAHAKVSGVLELPADINHRLLLNDTSVGTVVSPITKPPKIIDLRRLSFTSFESKSWRPLLDLSDPFDRDSYLRIERLYRSRGEDREANEIYYAMRQRAMRQMHGQREWLRWLFNNVQSALFGYGAKPGRLLAVAIVTILIGTFLFSGQGALIKKEASDEKPGVADPFIVSAKLFVPTPDLAPFEKFEPATKWAHIPFTHYVFLPSLYGLLHRFLGAIIVPVGVLFLTGFFLRR